MCECRASEPCRTCEGLAAIAAKITHDAAASAPAFAAPNQPHGLLRLSMSELEELWRHPLSDGLAAKVGAMRRALAANAAVNIEAMDAAEVYAAIDAAKRA